MSRASLTNLIDLFVKILTRINEGRAVDVIHIDFSSAVNKVPDGRRVQMFGPKGCQASWQIGLKTGLVIAASE